jgi:hypothetical protein
MAYPAPRVLKLQSSRLNSTFDYRGSCCCDSGRLLFSPRHGPGGLDLPPGPAGRPRHSANCPSKISVLGLGGKPESGGPTGPLSEPESHAAASFARLAVSALAVFAGII